MSLENLTCAVTAGWFVVDLNIRHIVCVGWVFLMMVMMVRVESIDSVLWQAETVLWE